MPAISKSARLCETCGSPIETTSSGDFGCMVCLFDAALDRDSEESEVAPAPALDPFGAYIIEHHVDGRAWELGRGAMGITYRAIDTVLDRPVALKIINTNVGSRSAEARERFMREARAAGALRHPNVATVYQFGIREETGQFFYAMELVEGETLEERVRRLGPLDVLTVIDIALQVTSALAAAEERGLVHRDLKPGNLMLVSVEAAPSLLQGVTRASRLDVKIIDFGVVKAIAQKTNVMALTHGGFVGTPAFASPEQFIDAPVDVRSDIYSLGATLWFLLNGQMPFSGRTAEEVRDARRSKPLPVEQLKAARVPRRFVALLTSMLAIEPAARPAGARELAVKLQKIRASIIDRGKIAARFTLAAAAILILGVAAFFAFHSLHTENSASNPPAPEKSIAVLPFENLSNNREDTFFADGVQDDLLTKLAKIAELKVISRTSVMQYRGKQNVREIGNALGVSYVVEGSVRMAGTRLRMNVQLINTHTDAHVWAEQYDRDLNDVFAVQSEITQKIAEQLQATLSPREKSAIEQPATRDLTAFDLYSRANDLILTASFSDDVSGLLLQTVDLLNQAVARDPSFFQAYCRLAFVHDRLYFLGYDHTAARLALAEAALQAAARLRPDAGETHLARAENLYDGYLDYYGALAELEVARQSLPNAARIYELMGLIQRRQGRWEESARNLDRAVELDPRDLDTLQQIAISYDLFRRYAEEISILDRALAIDPDHAETKVVRANVDLDWKADTQPLHQLINEIRAANPARLRGIANNWLICALAERDAVAAKEALIALGETPFLDGSVQWNRSFVEGLIARMTKDEEKARVAFVAARAEQERIVQAQPNYGPSRCALGLIYAALGHREEALREGRRAIELVPVEKDAIRGPAMHRYLAKIAAWVGDNDLACEQLAIATPVPSGVSYGQLKLMPWWDPLRGDSRFEEIVASLSLKRN